MDSIHLLILFCIFVYFSYFFFFFTATPTTEIYTLSYTTLFRSSQTTANGFERRSSPIVVSGPCPHTTRRSSGRTKRDRKSTRLNSSHLGISYAVFCLKKKKKKGIMYQ